MCFSASASFTASAALCTVGVVTLKNTTTRAQIPFGVIPVLFAIQQAVEGVLWISLSATDHVVWQHFPVYIFLVFAQIIWPIWVPFSILLLEKERTRKIILSVLLAVGTCISLYLLYCLVVYEVSAKIHAGHIQYKLNFPLAFAWISGVFYFAPTVLTLFASSFKRMWLLGIAILASFAVAKIFYEEHLISVWCFFAAVISIAILGILAKSKSEDKMLKRI